MLLNNTYLIFCTYIVVHDLEQDKANSFKALSSDLLPSTCTTWITSSSSSSTNFCTIYTADFRPKLVEKLTEIREEAAEALKGLNKSGKRLVEPNELITKNLKVIQDFFKRPLSKLTTDPWLNDLAIRHHSARFLNLNSSHLQILHQTYHQVKKLHTELALNIHQFCNQFFEIYSRFVPLVKSEKSIVGADFGIESGNFDGFGLMYSNTSVQSQWKNILKTYSLDYDWNLECPPLDGFLSTLYTTHLKSHGISLNISTSSHLLPQIFSEESLRFGFLQKTNSGILNLNRSWQTYFAIFQPITGFLHLYKATSLSNSNSNLNTTDSSSCTISNGNLLIPSSICNSSNNNAGYSKSSLQDLNILATQFFLQSTHNPASISPHVLTPNYSISIKKDSKVTATDPTNFAFSIRPAEGTDKMTLRAFCEEEFVDWVIFLNPSSTGNTVKPSKLTSPKEKEINSISEIAKSNFSVTSYESIDENELKSFKEQDDKDKELSSYSSGPSVVDLEDPWS